MALSEISPICFLNNKTACPRTCPGYQESLKRRLDPFLPSERQGEIDAMNSELATAIINKLGLEGAEEEADAMSITWCAYRDGGWADAS